MKKILVLILGMLCLFGCSKPDDVVDVDEYYVKYEFSCVVVQYGMLYATEYTISFADSHLEEQIRTYKTINEEEIICGPFKHGDKVFIALTHFHDDNRGGTTWAQTIINLHVSKNNSPFALQKTETSSTLSPKTTILEYVID